MADRGWRRVRRFKGMKPGAPPGTLQQNPEARPPAIRVLSYGPEQLVEREASIEELAEIVRATKPDPVTWIDVVGIDHAPSLEAIAEIFQLHPLVIEDVANAFQRPKTDPYSDEVFVVLRVPQPGDTIELEQVSLVVGADFVLSFQEKEGDCFGAVRQRIRDGRPRIRGSGPDYLAYALIDAAIDSFFPVFESHGERLEQLEHEVLTSADPATLARVQRVKRDLLRLRRNLWPYREMLSVLTREDTEGFSRETRVYLRDCYDHAVQLMDMVESYREIGSGLIDLHMSAVSNRMNDVMKTLTIIATIFIPLTFIAGIYGMNFDPGVSPWNMPELSWYWGYPMAWALMLGVGLLTAGYFWRKGWLGTSRSTDAEDESQ